MSAHSMFRDEEREFCNERPRDQEKLFRKICPHLSMSSIVLFPSTRVFNIHSFHTSEHVFQSLARLRYNVSLSLHAKGRLTGNVGALPFLLITLTPSRYSIISTHAQGLYPALCMIDISLHRP